MWPLKEVGRAVFGRFVDIQKSAICAHGSRPHAARATGPVVLMTHHVPSGRKVVQGKSEERVMNVGKRVATLSRSIRPVLALVALFLGLLGMHTLGVDHHVPDTTHLMSVVSTEQSHLPYTAPFSTQHTLFAPSGQQSVDSYPSSLESGSLTGLETAMLGMCVLGLAVGAFCFYIRPTSCRPNPGRGLSAPPTLWVPRERIYRPPSLVQLSISRT